MKETVSRTSDPATRAACQQIVRKLIAKYGWALLSEDELTTLTLNAAQTGAAPAELEKLAKRRYTRAIYNACRQAKDLDLRERGYYELFLYLYRVAHKRWPELAENAAQAALQLVYEQIDNCQNPDAFLSFAFYKLKQALKDEWRAIEKEKKLIGAYHERSTSFQLHQELQERLQILVQAIERIPDKRQQKAIFLKFFDELSDDAIANQLQIKISNVRVLRHRGLKQLRADEKLRDYFKN